MKLTQTKEYAILFLRQSEGFSDTEIANRLKIGIDDVRRVLKENGDKELDSSAAVEEEEPVEEPPIPEKTSKNSPKMKDLMVTKTRSGKEGIAAMTQEASEFSDAVRPNMENVRAARIQKHIFRPSEANKGSNE